MEGWMDGGREEGKNMLHVLQQGAKIQVREIKQYKFPVAK